MSTADSACIVRLCHQQQGREPKPQPPQHASVCARQSATHGGPAFRHKTNDGSRLSCRQMSSEAHRLNTPENDEHWLSTMTVEWLQQTADSRNISICICIALTRRMCRAGLILGHSTIASSHSSEPVPAWHRLAVQRCALCATSVDRRQCSSAAFANVSEHAVVLRTAQQE